MLVGVYLTPAAPSEKIVTGHEAISLLEQAVRDRVVLNLYINPNIAPLQSNLLSIYKQQLLIDTLRPVRRGHEVLPGDYFEAHFWFDHKGFYIFKTHYRGTVGTTSSQNLLELPDQIRQIQRRQAYRVIPPPSLSAICQSLAGKVAAPTTRVENISITGVCLSFVRSSAVRLGMRIPKVTLQLESADKITIDAIIRAIYRGLGGRFFLGLEWLDPSPNDQQILQTYILKCQREELKRIH